MSSCTGAAAGAGRAAMRARPTRQRAGPELHEWNPAPLSARWSEAMCPRSRVSTVQTTRVALTSGPLKARSWSIWLMLAPQDGDHPAQLREPARPVADLDGEAREPPVVDEALLDHAAQDDRVDVAAADDEHDALSAQARAIFPGHHRRERRRGRALDHGLLELEHPQDRERDPVLRRPAPRGPRAAG